MSPPTIYFSKNAYQDILIATPHLLIFEPRGHCPSQTQNCLVKVICCQTFCPLFVVLKNVCMGKSQFPHHFFSYPRSKWNKLPEDIAKDMQFFYPSCLLQLPTYLLSDFFQSPNLLPTLLFWTREYFIKAYTYKFFEQGGDEEVFEDNVDDSIDDLLCDYCQQNADKNPFGDPEELLICKDCGNKGSITKRSCYRRTIDKEKMLLIIFKTRHTLKGAIDF